MKEFGSDFHKCDEAFRDGKNHLRILGCARYFACGRYAIDAIIQKEGWKRIWMPAYFCYEIIEHIKGTGIEVVLYDDYPLNANDGEIVRSLPFLDGDVLFRTDYFGIRNWRSNEGIDVPVIEDHTHGLLTAWAVRSDADWCVASLRKSLPVAVGGILWSPRGHQLPEPMFASESCEMMAAERYEAMAQKKAYLNHSYGTEDEDSREKDVFRAKYIESEESIDTLSLCGIDRESAEIVQNMDIQAWTDIKYRNWKTAVSLLKHNFDVLGGEVCGVWQPFSIVLLMKSPEERECLRKYLVGHRIYPAILWRMPEDGEFSEAKDFSDRMLSIHCDARYGQSEIGEMCNLINGFYGSDL